ncbi:GDSL-type esterase/lipase family protein [Longirhabdus pacifica]|uniref:GDSL-type esterase/lipase family protein n=1 Tax=Longirhabdus pacifica TaxID=2305227 RepID=UPI00100904AD|nr:GDSL-type esterase/lipase family protein [Longirhabdus pacifica]
MKHIQQKIKWVAATALSLCLVFTFIPVQAEEAEELQVMPAMTETPTVEMHEMDDMKMEEAAVYKYVAFGDSITSGFEPGWTPESVPYGFVERVYEQALLQGRAEVNNYGVLGIETDVLLRLLTAISTENTEMTAEEIQANFYDPKLTEILSQLDVVKKNVQEADLITITIGGNDIIDLPNLLGEKTQEEIAAVFTERLQAIGTNLAESLQILYTLNPDAKIVISDQYQPIPEVAVGEEYAGLDLLRQTMTDQLSEVVAGFQSLGLDLSLALVAEPFVGNELAYTHIGVEDIHPNQMGYQKFAEIFSQQIWGEYSEISSVEPATILLEGQLFETAEMPVLLNDKVYVPIREYVETLGAKIEYDVETETTSVMKDGMTTEYKVTSFFADDNFETFTEGVFIYQGRTYVALTSFAEQMGLDLTVTGSDKIFLHSMYSKPLLEQETMEVESEDFELEINTEDLKLETDTEEPMMEEDTNAGM